MRPIIRQISAAADAQYGEIMSLFLLILFTPSDLHIGAVALNFRPAGINTGAGKTRETSP